MIFYFYLSWVWFWSLTFLLTRVWPLWCSGSTYDCEIICFQWPSYQNWTLTTYWSIWRIIVFPNGWWTGMTSVIIIASTDKETSLCCWGENDVGWVLDDFSTTNWKYINLHLSLISKTKLRFCIGMQSFLSLFLKIC